MGQKPTIASSTTSWQRAKRPVLSGGCAADQGDVLIWSADLAHGGAPVEDDSLTRRAAVGHYCPEWAVPRYFDQFPDRSAHARMEAATTRAPTTRSTSCRSVREQNVMSLMVQSLRARLASWGACSTRGTGGGGGAAKPLDDGILLIVVVASVAGVRIGPARWGRGLTWFYDEWELDPRPPYGHAQRLLGEPQRPPQPLAGTGRQGAVVHLWAHGLRGLSCDGLDPPRWDLPRAVRVPTAADAMVVRGGRDDDRPLSRLRVAGRSLAVPDSVHRLRVGWRRRGPPFLDRRDRCRLCRRRVSLGVSLACSGVGLPSVGAVRRRNLLCDGGRGRADDPGPPRGIRRLVRPVRGVAGQDLEHRSCGLRRPRRCRLGWRPCGPGDGRRPLPEQAGSWCCCRRDCKGPAGLSSVGCRLGVAHRVLGADGVESSRVE